MTEDALPDELAARLAAFVAAREDVDEVHIDHLHRVGEGSSRENWAFDARWTDADGRERSEALLLRRDPLSGVVDTGRRTEFDLLRALEATEVPAPRVVALDADGRTFDRPSMVVVRHAGVAHRGVLRERDPLDLGPERRSALAEELCDTLAALHRVDAATLGLERILPVPEPDPATSELVLWRQRLDEAALEPQPALELAWRWLNEHVPPPPSRHVIVHGDLRPANVLVADGRLESLLDWELARIGDPHDDLGWYLAEVYRHEHFIPGRWEPEQFLTRYREATGIDVDGSALRFWCGMAAFRLAVIALTAARSFCEGGSDRPSAPTERLVRRLARDVIVASPVSVGASA